MKGVNGHFTIVLKIFRLCLKKGGSWVPHGCFKGVSIVFQSYFKGVFMAFPGTFKGE